MYCDDLDLTPLSPRMQALHQDEIAFSSLPLPLLLGRGVDPNDDQQQETKKIVEPGHERLGRVWKTIDIPFFFLENSVIFSGVILYLFGL